MSSTLSLLTLTLDLFLVNSLSYILYNTASYHSCIILSNKYYYVQLLERRESSMVSNCLVAPHSVSLHRVNHCGTLSSIVQQTHRFEACPNRSRHSK